MISIKHPKTDHGVHAFASPRAIGLIGFPDHTNVLSDRIRPEGVEHKGRGKTC
jgi:hypothetical protein